MSRYRRADIEGSKVLAGACLGQGVLIDCCKIRFCLDRVGFAVVSIIRLSQAVIPELTPFKIPERVQTNPQI